mmetsp:Transcript_19555/g.47365  ORF Transcript_19555/g.47365 Transcript_19555/m.47365 type:complete len:206 (+) Transcript_19555:637-1254(+)
MGPWRSRLQDGERNRVMSGERNRQPKGGGARAAGRPPHSKPPHRRKATRGLRHGRGCDFSGRADRRVRWPRCHSPERAPGDRVPTGRLFLQFQGSNREPGDSRPALRHAGGPAVRGLQQHQVRLEHAPLRRLRPGMAHAVHDAQNDVHPIGRMVMPKLRGRWRVPAGGVPRDCDIRCQPPPERHCLPQRPSRVREGIQLWVLGGV